MEKPAYYLVPINKEDLGGVITTVYISPKEIEENKGEELKVLLDRKYSLSRLSMEMYLETLKEKKIQF